MVSLPVAGMPGLLVVGQMLVDLVIVHRVVPGYLVGGGAQIVAVGLRVSSLAGVGGFVNSNAFDRPQNPRPSGRVLWNVSGKQRDTVDAVNRLPQIGWIPRAGCAGSPAGQSDRQNDRQGDNNCKKPACDNQPFPVVRLAQKHPYRAF